MGKKRTAGKADYVLGLDQTKFTAGLKKAQKRFKSVGKSLAKVGAGGLFFGGGLVTGLSGAIGKASDFQEVFSKFETVFADRSKEVKKWGDDYAATVGRSKKQTAEFLAGTQDLLVPLGFEPGAAEGMSKQVVQLTSDLASFNNKTDGDVFRDLQAAITGSGEVMKKYGVVLDVAAVKQDLLNRGIDPKNATNAEKAQSRFNIILKGTTAAQGDAVRTAGSFANRMKALRASFDDLLVEVGTPFLNFLANVSGGISSAIRWVSDFVSENQTMVVTFGGILAGGVALSGALTGLGFGLMGISTAIGGLVTVGGAAISIFGALVSPIGLISVALGGGIFAFFKYTEAGQETANFLANTFGQLSRIFQTTFGGIKDALAGGELELAAQIAFEGVKLAVATALESILELFGSSIRQMTDQLAGLLKEVQQAATVITSALSVVVGTAANKSGDLLGFDTSGFEQSMEKVAKSVSRAINSIDSSAVGGKLFSAFDSEQLAKNLDELKGRAKDVSKEVRAAKAEAADPSKFNFQAADFVQQAANAGRALAAAGSFSVAEANRQVGRQDVTGVLKDEGKKDRAVSKDILSAIERLGGRYV